MSFRSHLTHFAFPGHADHAQSGEKLIADETVSRTNTAPPQHKTRRFSSRRRKPATMAYTPAPLRNSVDAEEVCPPSPSFLSHRKAREDSESQHHHHNHFRQRSKHVHVSLDPTMHRFLLHTFWMNLDLSLYKFEITQVAFLLHGLLLMTLACCLRVCG